MRWFKPFGIIFLPISIPGGIISLLAGCFLPAYFPLR